MYDHNRNSRSSTKFALLYATVVIAAASPISAIASPAPAASPADACIESFAGTYAVRHMEMGGGIELRSDGLFRYALAYGALDEEAAGRWTCDKSTVYLTSNPVRPPRFIVLGTGPGPHGQLRVTLDLPAGISRQYFSVVIRSANGSISERQFAEDGLTIDFDTRTRPLAIRPVLGVYEIAGDPIAIPPGDGVEVRLRFVPNDLGKVAFEHTPLRLDREKLLLVRFGETIPFERADSTPAP